jgi:hypothetical protein
MVAGSLVAVGGTASVDDALALQLVNNGDATATLADNGTAPGNFEVVFSGTRSWAGGAAATDALTLTGLKATDIVNATLRARASTETLVLAVPTTNTLTFTLSANGTNTTTKIDYKVLRPL